MSWGPTRLNAERREKRRPGVGKQMTCKRVRAEYRARTSDARCLRSGNVKLSCSCRFPVRLTRMADRACRRGLTSLSGAEHPCTGLQVPKAAICLVLVFWRHRAKSGDTHSNVDADFGAAPKAEHV